MLYSIDEIKKIVRPIAKRFGVERMWLFGSYARGDSTKDSDLDFRLDGGAIRGYFKLAEFYYDLEEALGMKLDLITTGAMDNIFRQRIAKEEVLVYEQES
jgi:predicted nucleotidyltransferase